MTLTRYTLTVSFFSNRDVSSNARTFESSVIKDLKKLQLIQLNYFQEFHDDFFQKIFPPKVLDFDAINSLKLDTQELKKMTTVLNMLKQEYQIQLNENPSDFQVFKIDCLQRIGKQIISVFISAGLIKSETNPTNRQISNALKIFEQNLMEKMRLRDKRQLYRIFGNYCFDGLSSMPDGDLVGLELIFNFFKTLDQQQARQLPASTFVHRKYIYQDFQAPSKYSQTTKPSTVYKFQTDAERKRDFFNQIRQFQTKRQEIFNPKKETKNQQMPDGDDDESFQFEQTEDDKQKNNRKLCEDYFIQIVRYLLTLSSPQGELTYIWQHLKWQGFETFYDQFMNDNHEWVCTARIRFPQSMIDDNNPEFMERTQCSKNKKKARQLACMDLLKSLYLEYPEVWMIYKHLKEEKKLVIAPLEEEKDEDEIALINDRIHYKINIEKIEKVFRHNKTDIRKMMEKISAKAELNTLLQQLPGRVTSPKLAKKIEDGNWKVAVRIEYKTADDIQENRPPKVYERTVVFPNTKIAEEEAYMEAIIQMYQKNPDLFQKIQAIKIAKKIKDPEKKVPLLRQARIAKEGYL